MIAYANIIIWRDYTVRIVERGICLNCGLITTSEYFEGNKCPCCFGDNIKLFSQTDKEIDRQIKKIKKIGKAQYILSEYGEQIDESLQEKVDKFYAELDRQMQIQFKKEIAEINRNAPKPYDPRQHGLVECPYCRSRDTEKISSLSRAASVGFFGLGSKKIGKQWHCNKCKSDF